MLLEAHCCFLTDVCSRKRNEESMLQILSSFKYFCFKHVNILNAFFKCTIIVQAVFSAEGRGNQSWHRRTTVTNPLCKLQVSHSYPWNLCQYFWRHMHKGFCINGKAAAVMKYFPWLQKRELIVLWAAKRNLTLIAFYICHSYTVCGKWLPVRALSNIAFLAHNDNLKKREHYV